MCMKNLSAGTGFVFVTKFSARTSQIGIDFLARYVVFVHLYILVMVWCGGGKLCFSMLLFLSTTVSFQLVVSSASCFKV